MQSKFAAGLIPIRLLWLGACFDSRKLHLLCILLDCQSVVILEAHSVASLSLEIQLKECVADIGENVIVTC